LDITSKRLGQYWSATGYLDGSSLGDDGSYGFYCSATASGDCSYAYGLTFNSSSNYWFGYYRYYGRTVRPVMELAE